MLQHLPVSVDLTELNQILTSLRDTIAAQQSEIHSLRGRVESLEAEQRQQAMLQQQLQQQQQQSRSTEREQTIDHSQLDAAFECFSLSHLSPLERELSHLRALVHGVRQQHEELQQERQQLRASPGRLQQKGDPSSSSFDVEAPTFSQALLTVQQDLQDLITLFDIPHARTSGSQRPTTMDSLHWLAKGSSAQRVKYLHSLPVFHQLIQQYLWKQQQQQQQTPPPQQHSRLLVNDDGAAGGARTPLASSSGVLGPSAATNRTDSHFAASPFSYFETMRQSSPSSSYRKGSFHSQLSTVQDGQPNVFVPQLGADVAASRGAQGVIVTRTVRGGPLSTAGVQDGDWLLSVDDVPIAGTFHLMELMAERERLARRGGQAKDNEGAGHSSPHVLNLRVIPGGRSSCIPLNIRCTF